MHAICVDFLLHWWDNALAEEVLASLELCHVSFASFTCVCAPAPLVYLFLAPKTHDLLWTTSDETIVIREVRIRLLLLLDLVNLVLTVLENVVLGLSILLFGMNLFLLELEDLLIYVLLLLLF